MAWMPSWELPAMRMTASGMARWVGALFDLVVGADGLRVLVRRARKGHEVAAQRGHPRHLVHEAVGFGLFGSHEIVAVRVFLDLFYRAPAMLGDDAVDAVLELEHVAHADLDIAGRAFGPAQQLVDHDVRVGQRVALALGPAAKQDRAHAGGLADAVGVHVAG